MAIVFTIKWMKYIEKIKKKKEIYLISSNEVLPNERKYMTYASLGLSKDLNDFVSVPVKEEYTIV
jgi:hypothetical protein